MREYKINMDRTDPTPEEIAKNKDFSKVLDKYSAMSTPIYTKSWFLSTAVLVIAAGLLIIANLVNFNKDPVTDAEQSFVYQPAEMDLITEAPYVNPPMEGVDIAYESFMVESNEKSKIEYSTGTKIKIPKNTFVNAEGEAIEGKIEVKYREFHDVTDFFVSGIPMDYDSAGEDYVFESAGMMEMLAFQNGEPVFIKSGKEIKVEMASQYEGTHYNLYELDEANRKWEHRGKDQVTPAEVIEVRPDPIAPREEAEAFDTEEISNVEPEFILESKYEQPVKKLESRLKIAKVEVKKVQKTKPLKPIAVNKERYNFDLEVNPEQFPEIGVYQGTRFEIGEENTNFNASMYKIDWTDVLLEEKEPGINYNLTLSKGETKYTWVVYPVYEGTDLVTAKKVYQKKFNAYKDKLSTRVLEEKKAQELLDAQLLELEKTRAEQLVLWEEQNRQYMEAQKLRTERMRTRQSAIRAFNITRFGTWNCDSPVKRPRGRSVAASFEDQDGNLLHFNAVYLMQKDQNAMFTYYPNMLNKLKFNPSEKNVIWAVTSDNRLAVFESDRFSEISRRDGDFTFKMKVLKNEMGSVADIRAAISI